MSKRIICAAFAIFLLLSLYSSYSTMGGKSSFFFSTLVVEDKEVSTHYDEDTSLQSQFMSFLNDTQSMLYSSFASNKTLSTVLNDSEPLAVGHGGIFQETSTRNATIPQSTLASVSNGSNPLPVPMEPHAPSSDNIAPQNKTWSPLPNQTLSILVQLSGEMGNNLDKIAHGICMQEWLKDEFNTPSTMYFRHQTVSKWTKGRRNTVLCFPWAKQFDFAAGNTPSIDIFLKQKPDWYPRMANINGNNATEIHEALRFSVDLWHENIANGTAFSNYTANDDTHLSAPFLHSNKFVHLHVCMDKYYDVIRERFQIDKKACCDQVPAANETVFHFRNFLGEMVRKGKKLGFEELNPKDTAEILLGNLTAGDRVAITARARDASAAQSYIDALAERNVSARVITSKLDVHDFCFLQQTQRELVGAAISTFVTWAGLLNNASARVRLYSIHSAATNRARGGNWFFKYNWTHPALKDRISYEGYSQ